MAVPLRRFRFLLIVLTAALPFGAAACALWYFVIAGLLAGHSPEKVDPEPKKAAAAILPKRFDSLGDELTEYAVMRLGTTRLRLVDTSVPFSISADGSKLAHLKWDKTVALCDTRTGKELHRFGDEKEPCYCGTITPDGKTVIVGGDKCIRYWDAQGGKLRKTVNVNATVTFLVVSCDGQRIAAAFSDHKIRILILATAEEQVTYSGISGRVHALGFSRDGKLLAAAGDDGSSVVAPSYSTFVWSTDSGEQKLFIAHGQNKGVSSVALSPDGGRLALAFSSKLQLWDVSNQVMLWNRKFFGRAATFSEDGTTIATGGPDESLVLLDVTTEQVKRRYFLEDKSIAQIILSTNTNLLLASASSVITRWNLDTGELIGSSPGHRSPITALAYSPNGKNLVSVGSELFTWNPRTGEHLGSLTNPGALPGMGPRRVDYVEMGSKLAIPCGLRGIAFLSLDKHAISDLVSLGDFVDAIGVSPDGSTLAAATSERISLYRTATHQVLRNLKQRRPRIDNPVVVKDIAFSPDGTVLACCFRRDDAVPTTVEVYDVPNGSRRLQLAADSIRTDAIEFSPDGRMLAAVGISDGIRLWEVDSGALIRTIELNWRIVTDAIAFSPDGYLLVVGGTDGLVHLIETVTGREILALAGHSLNINCVKFSPDGTRFATAGGDKTVLIWSALSEACRTPKKMIASDREELLKAWDLLAVEDPSRAYLGIRCLLLAEQQAVEVLTEKLPAAQEPAPSVVERLVAAAIGEPATLEGANWEKLIGPGEEPEAIAKAALRRSPKGRAHDTIEATRRRLLSNPLTPASLQRLRGVQILEWIGTDDARVALTKLSLGDQESRLTQACKDALCRLAKTSIGKK